MKHPLFEFDNKMKNHKELALNLNLEPYDFIIGTDEAGRGPAAGGVFAAAVCFFDDCDIELFKILNDSKKLSESQRNSLFEPIKSNSWWAVDASDVEKIEKINILNAGLSSMKTAVNEVLEKLNSKNICVLVDGNKKILDFKYPQTTVIKGDSKSASIAAASILAKVTRDNYMTELDRQYPQYDWINNKGYLTKTHIEAIKKYGICPFHRKSFLKNILDAPSDNPLRL